MKFTNGQWLLQEGCEIFNPQEVYFEKVVGNTLVLTTPTHRINHRGDTLAGVILTIEISTPHEEMIRVKTYHYKGVVSKAPQFELNLQDNPLDYTSTEDEIVVRSGTLRLVINKKNWSMNYYRGEELITYHGGRDLGYVKTDWKGFAYDKPTNENSFMQGHLNFSVGELVYGMGERFTPFVKNGQVVELWNEDGGTSTYQSYKNIPFYITNKGYGVFINNPDKVSLEVGSEHVNKVNFTVPGQELDFFFINGPEMKDVLERYTDLTGKPALPKAWTYGLWLSTSFTTSYDEDTVFSFINGMLERDIPLEVFHFDCFWMKDFHWSDFTWDERVFSDPEKMLKRIKDLGIKICVWINPYIAQESSLFDEGMEHGYFIKRENGDVWQWDLWQPGMAIVDFTNPEACKWYRGKLERLLDMGVDCFKTDFGERIPTDVVYHNGADPNKMHNFYTYLFNKEVYELLQEKRGKDDAILFARSATAGGQKFPVHWGGDCWSNYESMAESLRGGLSLTMSGFGYWSHDIGGFESMSSADVYKRWCAFGLLSSHSRLHGSTSYRVPWLYDDEAVDVLRSFTKLKATLMPYIYSISMEASEKGIPTMRSMVLEFTEDKNTHYLDRQYMFGDALLVAPIFNEMGKAEYYLPVGNWTNFFTQEDMPGNQWYDEIHDYFSVPLMVRENTILPIGSKDNEFDYDFAKNVDLQIYSLLENEECSRIVYDTNGNEKLRISVVKSNGEVKVNLKASDKCTLTFVNLKVSHEEIDVAFDGDNSIIKLDEGAIEKQFVFKL
ncbi:MAG TPA: alpha-xylosidase [Natronincola sp.]|nr:alpha-xylosidase [Natronincola sp.]